MNKLFILIAILALLLVGCETTDEGTGKEVPSGLINQEPLLPYEDDATQGQERVDEDF